MDGTTQWMRWSEAPWIAKFESGSGALQLVDRLLTAVLESENVTQLLRSQLPEIATEHSAQWSAVIQRRPDWTTVAECGRHGFDKLPMHIFEEALDREASGRLTNDSGWTLVVVPISIRVQPASVLVLAGRNLTDDVIGSAMCVGAALGHAISYVNARMQGARRIERLETTLRISASFSVSRDVESLLETIANAATDLLQCDRASIFIWDREAHELVACPALGMEDKTLRLPDSVGIVGDTIQNGTSINVPDAYADARFNQAVDKATGYRTHNLVCVPLLDVNGKRIGAFQGINKLDGPFTKDDEESLTEIGLQAANALASVQERERLARSRNQLAEQVTERVRIIGESPAITALRDTIARLANTELPVLILGESGTGKEVVSQSLHYQGKRAEHPFVAVNCAALAESLLESELFGHEKGAFTDAQDTRKGKFELADGGTLFLDEIGDMSPGGQAKLLRVLEQKVVTRVGGSQSIPTNVRVVAATNVNLAEKVGQKKFRQDLYYRLSVVTLDIPALRDRPEDILALAEYFLSIFACDAGRPRLKLSNDARRRLQAHAWPGNVRELRNLMERVAFLCPGERVEVDDLAFILSPERDGDGGGLEPGIDLGLDDGTRQFQREFIRKAIKRVSGNMSEAAKILGLHRSNLYRKMRQLEMSEAGGEE
ncbi:MAG: sigma-54-dependent Fis family transcriptional regulator [Planctomycetota bacterium]|nr:sigma-54-dependent Fis family transcriptional regulator [Planctomycetota bacterium]